MTDERSESGAEHPLQEVGDDKGEGGEADIKPEVGVNDGRPDDADKSRQPDLSGS